MIVHVFNVTGCVLPQDQQHGPACLLGRQEKELVVERLLESPGMYRDELQLIGYSSLGAF